MLIDDFSSGDFIQVQGPTGFGTPEEFVGFQTGTMVGGVREAAFETGALAGSTSLSEVSVGNGQFEMEAGRDIAQRITLIYGLDGATVPLGLDLRGEDRIRVNFAYNSASLNFNILLYNGITPYVQIGLNVPASASPFSADFIFADGSYPGGAIDFSHIDLIYVQTQDDNVMAGQSYAINSIVAVPEPGTAALAGAGLLALCAWRRRPGQPG